MIVYLSDLDVIVRYRDAFEGFPLEASTTKVALATPSFRIYMVDVLFELGSQIPHPKMMKE